MPKTRHTPEDASLTFKVKLVDAGDVIASRVMELDGRTPETLKAIDDFRDEVLSFRKIGFTGSLKLEAVKEDEGGGAMVGRPREPRRGLSEKKRNSEAKSRPGKSGER